MKTILEIKSLDEFNRLDIAEDSISELRLGDIETEGPRETNEGGGGETKRTEYKRNMRCSKKNSYY